MYYLSQMLKVWTTVAVAASLTVSPEGWIVTEMVLPDADANPVTVQIPVVR